MSRLSDRLIDSDDSDTVPAPPRPSKQTRKSRASPRLASSSLYSTTASPHSDDGYSRAANEQRDDLYAARRPARLSTPVVAAAESDTSGGTDAVLLSDDAAVADGKQRRYTCWGACGGCGMTKTQYALSVLLLVLLCVTTVLLVVFLAVLPAVINGLVRSAAISVTSVSISAPSNASFRLNTSFTLSNTGSFAASLSAMHVALSYRLLDGSLSAVLGQLELPSLSLPGGEAVVVGVDSEFVVSDAAAFDSFMHATLMQANVTWHLSSSVDVNGKVAGVSLPTYRSIPFEKDVTVSGCGGLNDTVVQSFSLSHPAASVGSSNLTLAIELVNPSALAISPLGTLHFELSYQSVHIGDVYSYDTALVPGRNRLSMQGTLLQSNTSAENELVERFVSGAVAVARATAASDASSVALFNGGLQGLTLQTALPGYTGAIIESVAMSSFSIAFNVSTPSTALVSSFARASFALPSNVDMPVLGIASTNITATAGLSPSSPIGVLEAVNVPVLYEPHTGSADYLNISIPPSPLQVSAEQSAAFGQFAGDLLLSSSATLQLQLVAGPLTSTPLGNLSLSVPASASVTFTGMGRFVDASTGESLMQVLSFDIVDTSADWLLLHITLTVTNPSNVSLQQLGELRLDLAYNDTRIGRVSVPSFQLPLGTAQHEAYANLSRPTTSAQEAAVLGLVSAMINRTASNITLYGGLQQPDGSVVAGTDIVLLQSAISSFSSPTIFPGLSQPLIDSFMVFIVPAFVGPYLQIGCPHLYINTTMYVHNPFSTWMYLTGADIDVYISPETIGAAAINITSMQYKMGDWHVDMSDRPLVIPPRTTGNASAVGPFLIRLTLDYSMASFVTGLYFSGTPLQLDSVGTIRTNLSTADPQLGGAAMAAFSQRVHVDARNVTGQMNFAELPEYVLPPVTWGPPLFNNGTCPWGCKTQCLVPCVCDAVLCRYSDCAQGLANATGWL